MPSPPGKFIPAICLLTFPGVGEGRNFTTATVIGVESLTPHGRAGCWNNCITSILVIHLTYGVASFDGLPFPLVEHLHTTFVPGRWVGGACWSSIWPVHYETVNEKLWMKRNRCQSISTFRPTGKWRPLYRLQKHVRCNSQRHSWEYISLSST